MVLTIGNTASEDPIPLPGLQVYLSQSTIPVSGLVGGIVKIIADVISGLDLIIFYLNLGVEAIVATLFDLINTILEDLLNTIFQTISNIFGALGRIPILGGIFDDIDDKNQHCLADVYSGTLIKAGLNSTACINDMLDDVIGALGDALNEIKDLLNSVTLLLTEIKVESLLDIPADTIEGLIEQLKLLIGVIVKLIVFIVSIIFENLENLGCLVGVVLTLIFKVVSEIFEFIGCLLS